MRKTLKTQIILVLFLMGVSMLLSGNISVTREQHFSHLANSFLKGRLHFLDIPSTSGWADTSPFNGEYYWPLGVFPAVVMVPAVAVFGTIFLQGYISLLLTLITAFLAYKIAEKITEGTTKALFLSFAYIFGSAHFMVAFAPFSWYFSHVVTTFCLFAALYFSLIKERPLLSGIFFTFAFLSRISTSLGILFFLGYYLILKKETSIKKLEYFLPPVLAGIGIFFAYNYLRFENIFETGYKYQIMLPPEVESNRDIAMWSFKHFPENIHLMFFKLPRILFHKGSTTIQSIKPNHLGMSFIFTSPIFLYLTKANFKQNINKISGITALIIALFLFGSFGLGSYQYGYRFALDFQPFLFLILCDVFKKEKINVEKMILITMSFFFNMYMIGQFFG